MRGYAELRQSVPASKRFSKTTPRRKSSNSVNVTKIVNSLTLALTLWRSNLVGLRVYNAGFNNNRE